MTIRKLLLYAGMLGLLSSGVVSADLPPPTKVDYTALSNLIHKVAVGQLPKEFRGENGWGGTTPIEEGLRLMRRRQTLQVGDHLEWPHGQWRKTHAWLEDPERDLKIKVLDLRPKGNKGYQIALDVDATIRGDTHVQQWQKGLLLADITAQADVRVGISLECDVALSLSTGFPPEVNVEPKVTDLKLDLKELNLHQVQGRRLGRVILEGQAGRDLGNEIRTALKDVLRASEPTIKDRANETIARSLKEGKGRFSATTLFNALSTKPKAQATK